MENYFINKNSLFIIPYGKNKSKVVEKYCSYILNKNINEIIDESCKYYGSSYHGRCQGTEYLIGIRYKCPIIISELKEIVFFPTASSKSEDCIWINYSEIEKYYDNSNNKVTIMFKNQRKIEVLSSGRKIGNQILRSSRLESVLKSKK